MMYWKRMSWRRVCWRNAACHSGANGIGSGDGGSLAIRIHGSSKCGKEKWRRSDGGDGDGDGRSGREGSAERG